MKAVTPITIKVKLVASWRLGQLTFFNSTRVSFKYLITMFSFLAVAFATGPFSRNGKIMNPLGLLIGQSRHRLITQGSRDGVLIATHLAGQAGLEPATYGFGDRCSAKLSYWPVWYSC